MISQEKISEVRERASIVEVISDYVALKKAGRNYVGLCPFHAEKTPSFTVSAEKGIFHCFGCQSGGSVFNFLMQYDHVSFPEAVERIAKRYGIVIPRGSQSPANTNDSLYRVNELVAAHYHRLLAHPSLGKKARDYLKSRGITEASAERFRLGFAPAGGAGLARLLQNEKLAVQDAIRLGLLGERSRGALYEKFFARLMFPIFNAAGKVIAFGGRVLDGGFPKYLNCSETPLFHKGSTLYGLYQAKEAIRTADRVVVVEGYLDVIALHQCGVGYAVATLGTALTPEHVRVLARYTKEIIALFDGDDAGRKAAARSFEIFVEAGLIGKAAFLPRGDDPDTFVRREGQEGIERRLAEAVPLADYFFTWQEERHGRTLEGKSRIATEISRLLAKVQNPLEVDLLVRRAVDTLGVREETLRRPPMAASRTALRRAIPVPSSARGDVAERSLLSLVLRFPQIAARVTQEEGAREWIGENWRELFDLIVAEYHERGRVDPSRLTEKVPANRAPEIAALALEGEKIADALCDQMAADCLAHLRRRHLRSLERNLRLAIRAAEERSDDKAKRERILEWQDVVRKERQLERQRTEAKNPPR
ncbi:MAG TPA: DNA primase [Candidatus Eisenbacteria bacterium]|nr:DNA primase [Candidatus Eisenbacteria bacterium]